MNLGDPELELIDPTPNVHLLFVHFDKLFFWSKLSCRTAVRWSKRMYSCAGTCSYAGRSGGGFVDIALSEPLLKLRPRKDLIETLLHEMIHAYLFIVGRDRDRDGHGPNFKSHMFRINQLAGLNISIYHNFHDEVKKYQTHWWRCNGRCQSRKPYFGIVRRTCNNAPGPRDYWWKEHLRNCGGTFIKIKEPEKKEKKEVTAKQKQPKVISKANGDITKYVQNNNSPKSVNSAIPTSIVSKPTLVDSLFVDEQSVKGKRERSNSVDVVETVRSVWANKFTGQDVTNVNTVGQKSNSNHPKSKATPNRKHKTNSVEENSHPEKKMKKIDDFFTIAAPKLLKNVYGQDFKVTQTNDKKIIAMASVDLVDCPICKEKIKSQVINTHLDECLNRDVIETLCKTNEESKVPTQSLIPINHIDKKGLKKMIGTLLPIPEFKGKVEKSLKSVTSNPSVDKNEVQSLLRQKEANQNNEKHIDDVNIQSSKEAEPNIQEEDDVFNQNISLSGYADIVLAKTIDLTGMDTIIKPITEKHLKPSSHCKKTSDLNSQFNNDDVMKVKAIVKKINFDKHVRKSDNFIVAKEEDISVANVGYLPSFLDEIARDIKVPPLKIKSGADCLHTNEQKCPCCGDKIVTPLVEHLDDCLAFFSNDVSFSDEGPSTSFADRTIVIDDDDDDGLFDETMTMNATGTKYPCPCCLKMVEQTEMNIHLDTCLK